MMILMMIMMMILMMIMMMIVMMMIVMMMMMIMIMLIMMMMMMMMMTIMMMKLIRFMAALNPRYILQRQSANPIYPASATVSRAACRALLDGRMEASSAVWRRLPEAPSNRGSQKSSPMMVALLMSRAADMTCGGLMECHRLPAV